MDIFCNFLKAVKQNYKPNAFHNFNHALAVLHTSFFITELTSMKQYYFCQFDQQCMVFAALCHDIGHRGFNNDYEKKTYSNLAIKYHDKSVLEQYHAYLAFSLLQKKEFNIFENMKMTDYRKFRSFITTAILYTDMFYHFPLMEKYKKKFDDIENMGIEKYQEQQTREDIELFGGFILHLCDFAGQIKPFHIARQWSERVNTEFFKQYNLELEKNLTPTPFFKDLDKEDVICKVEKGFIQVFQKPLWDLANKYTFGELQQCVDVVNSNFDEWNRIFLEFEKQKESQNEQASSMQKSGEISKDNKDSKKKDDK